MKPPPSVSPVPGYRLIRELGSGGSGKVYRAEQIELGREVALKLLSPGLFRAEELRNRFLREARLQGSLLHPNLVRVYDAGFSGDTPYLATELVDGGSLRGLLQARGRLSPAESARAGAAIASGLAQAHGAFIIHRDLKPENILIDSSGDVKVADFGLARGVSGKQTVQTAEGTLMGTPGYIAPEVLAGRPYTESSDLYALGVVLFEMVAGRRPFVCASLSELFARVAGEVAPRLDAACREVSFSLAGLVAECLAREPQERPRSAGLVCTRLEEVLDELEAGDSGAALAMQASLSSQTVPMELVKQSSRRPAGRRLPSSSTRTIVQTGARPAAKPEVPQRSPGRIAIAAGAVAIVVLVSAAGLAYLPRSGDGRDGARQIGSAAEGEPGATPLPSSSGERGDLSPGVAREAGRTGEGLPRTPGGAVLTLPAVKEIRTGPFSAVLHLDRPAPSELRVEYWKEGSSSRISRQVSEGATEVRLNRLEPLSGHRARLSVGRTTLETGFATLEFRAPSFTSTLARGSFLTSSVTAVVRDGTVHAIWELESNPETRPITRETVLFESSDGCATWLGPRRLFAVDDFTSIPFLGSGPEGMLHGFSHWLEEGHRTSAMGFDSATGRWSRPVTRDDLTLASPAAVSTRDGMYLVMADGERFTHVRVSADPESLPERLPPRLMPAAWFKPLEWRDGRLVVFSQLFGDGKSTPRRLLWAHSVVPPGVDPHPGWSPPARLLAPSVDVVTFDAAADRDQIVLVYETASGLHWTRSGDALTFSPSRRLELPGTVSTELGTLLASDRGLLLAVAAVTWKALEIQLFRLNGAGDAWEPLLRIPRGFMDLKQMLMLELPDRIAILTSDRSLGMACVLLRKTPDGLEPMLPE